MKQQVLLDTGPLVAFLDRKDRYHDWSLAVWDEIQPPLLTCESVLSEACFLLRESEGDETAVLELVERGVVGIKFDLETELSSVRRLLARYRDVPMSLADGCLVRMSELLARSALLTVDSDFRIYRKSGRQVIPLIAP